MDQKLIFWWSTESIISNGPGKNWKIKEKIVALKYKNLRRNHEKYWEIVKNWSIVQKSILWLSIFQN